MNLFVYGTLLVPRILNAVTGLDDLETIPAKLEGYDIFRVMGGDFPGIVKGAGPVPGRVVQNVPEMAMRRLDAYEDSFYERELVEISTSDGTLEAFAYVVPAEIAKEILSSQTWTLEWFEREALDRYWKRLFE